MRDLEIRGAGNLLGPEQSGHITAVGFDLYCQLLKQSVSALKGEKVRPRVEVQMRLDFLALNQGEEQAANEEGPSGPPKKAEPSLNISVPREVATYARNETEPASIQPKPAVQRASAYIPFQYVSEARQRIEIYRKLAQATDKLSLDRLRDEMRDRFGRLPPAVELLLQATELKILASLRGIQVIESKEDKLMLTRNGDFITLGGKFPRLMKKDARARLNEIKKLLLALGG
jgi:transcription-repair coupling factor (superfamily II helicase)